MKSSEMGQSYYDSQSLHRPISYYYIFVSLSGNRLSFSELFDDISLMLKGRRLCMVVDSLISATEVCFPHGVDRYVIAWLDCGWPKYS